MTVATVEAEPGGVAVVGIDLQGITRLDAFGFDLMFDCEKLAYLDVVHADSVCGDWAIVAGHEIAEGHVRVGGFRGSGASAVKVSQPLLKVRFLVKPKAENESTLVPDRLKDDLARAVVREGRIIIRQGTTFVEGQLWDPYR